MTQPGQKNTTGEADESDDVARRFGRSDDGRTVSGKWEESGAFGVDGETGSEASAACGRDG